MIAERDWRDGRDEVGIQSDYVAPFSHVSRFMRHGLWCWQRIRTASANDSVALLGASPRSIQYDRQLKSIAGEMMSQGSQLDKLAHSFREVSTALKALAKTSAIS